MFLLITLKRMVGTTQNLVYIIFDMLLLNGYIKEACKGIQKIVIKDNILASPKLRTFWL